MSSDQSDPAAVDLCSSWTLFFHDPDDRNWGVESYCRVCTVYTANEYWGVQHRLDENNAIGKGMWFLMRDDVFPCWDDQSNINGGCLSYMVSKNDVARTWQEFCELLLTERLRADGGDDAEHINGISVSPKNDFCILKVWMRTQELTAQESLRPRRSAMFTSNRSKIANDRA